MLEFSRCSEVGECQRQGEPISAKENTDAREEGCVEKAQVVDFADGENKVEDRYVLSVMGAGLDFSGRVGE